MAKDKLIPKASPDDDKRDARDKFTDLATRIFAVPKSEIDKREQRWRAAKRKRKAT